MRPPASEANKGVERRDRETRFGGQGSVPPLFEDRRHRYRCNPRASFAVMCFLAHDDGWRGVNPFRNVSIPDRKMVNRPDEGAFRAIRLIPRKDLPPAIQAI